MTRAAQRVLETFEALPQPDKQAVALEILRHSIDEDYPSPGDEDLAFAADQVFLLLDREEDGE